MHKSAESSALHGATLRTNNPLLGGLASATRLCCNAGRPLGGMPRAAPPAHLPSPTRLRLPYRVLHALPYDSSTRTAPMNGSPPPRVLLT